MNTLQGITNLGVKKAVNHLTISNPFFSTILINNDIVEDNTCETFYTDGSKIGYNSEYSDSLTFNKRVGVLVHEVFHIFLLHTVRMPEECKLNKELFELYNKAADYAINPEILKAGFELPDGALVDKRFYNKSVLDIYNILKAEERQKQKQPQSGGGESNKNKSEKNFGEVRMAKDKAATEEKIKIATNQAHIISKAFGQTPNGELIKVINNSQKAVYNWRENIARFIVDSYPSDYSFARVNRRHLHRGIILPTLFTKVVGHIAIALDTSGSQSKEALQTITNEILGCMETVMESKQNVTIPVIYCDSAVHGYDLISEDNEAIIPKGGGGTAFKPVFDYIEKNEDGIFDNLRGLIYITDGFRACEQINEPDFPVLWLITTDYGLDYYKRPFGEDIRFDIF